VERRSIGRENVSSVQAVAAAGQRMLLTGTLLAHDDAGQMIGVGDFAAQCRFVFEELKEVLHEAGGKLENVVRLTAFLASLDDYRTFLAIRKEYFSETKPATGTFKTAGFVRPEALVGIEATALLD
jgi:enamine deaminase RidA (YjgF/YER057c/UK114 family)